MGQLIERRLRQLSAPALALARVAAVAGTDFHIELAQAVLDTRALALADAWHELEAAQVLRGNAFAHDLVHEATLAGVPAPIAAHTHGEVAAFLEGHGGEPARVAAHWIAAGQPPRALVALHAAADAARHAMRRKEEAAFLAQAAQIESDAGDTHAAYASRRAMIDAMWVVDLGALSATMFDQLEAAAITTSERAAALALRASWRQECGDLEAAKRLAQAAIELADESGDESTAVDARQRLATIARLERRARDIAGAVAAIAALGRRAGQRLRAGRVLRAAGASCWTTTIAVARRALSPAGDRCLPPIGNMERRGHRAGQPGHQLGQRRSHAARDRDHARCAATGVGARRCARQCGVAVHRDAQRAA